MKIPYKWLKEYINTDLSPREVAELLTMTGHALDKPLFEQGGDVVMDLEDRGNRGDASGVIGIAREFAALTSQKVKYPKVSQIPAVNNEKFGKNITVKSEKVTRWKAVIFNNVKVEKSPEWITEKLTAYGIEPYNTIVDITNLVMLEYGMPLHAFDMDTFDEIILRQAKKGETLVTFDGTTLEFDENDLIASDSKKPLTLTTAVGGRESGITDATTNILIEAGLYEQKTVRRSALRLNVRNESSLRLGKYLHPDFCELAIARTIELIKEVCNLNPESASFDYYPKKYPEVFVTLTSQRLEKISGFKIEMEKAKEILENLEFKIENFSGESLKAKVPYFRTDVTMEDDLIEEVLRIIGYTNIPSIKIVAEVPEKLSFPVMEMENNIKEKLVLLGLDEVSTEQIIDLEICEKIGLCDSNTNSVVKLENSWNSELNALRFELFTSLIKYFSSYEKRGNTNIQLFECGKTFSMSSQHMLGSANLSKTGYEKYKEHRITGILVEGDFYKAKSILNTLLAELKIKNLKFEKFEHVLFKKERSAVIKIEGEIVGEAGEVKQKTLNTLGLEKTISYIELNTEKLLNSQEKSNVIAASFESKSYISEDFTFVMERDGEVGGLLDEIKRALGDTGKVTLKDVYTENRKSVTFNIKFERISEKKLEDQKNKIKSLQKKFI